MDTMNLYLDEPPRFTGPTLAEITEKLDRIQTAVEALDRRREELEELVTDLLPAVNGMILQVSSRMDALEKSGALALVREAAGALEVAAGEIDPADVRALGQGAATGMRALLALTEPEVAAVAERAVKGIRAARTGKPPRLRALWRMSKEPRVRRGMGALLEVLRGLGEGVPGATSSGVALGERPVRAPGPRPAPSRPAAARPGPQRAPAASGGHPGPAVGGMTVELAGRPVALDGEGFMVDRDDWSREVAQALADEAGIGLLTDAHWEVIEFCRADALQTGAAPGLRRITQKLGTPPKTLYTLFPKGPGILSARIAGLSKPKSCV